MTGDRGGGQPGGWRHRVRRPLGAKAGLLQPDDAPVWNLSDVPGPVAPEGGNAAAQRSKRATTTARVYSILQLPAKLLGFVLTVVLAASVNSSALGEFVGDVLYSGFLAFLIEFGAASVVLRAATLRIHIDRLTSHIVLRCGALWSAGIVLGGLSFAIRDHALQRCCIVLAVAAVMAGNSIAASALLGLHLGMWSSMPSVVFNAVSVIVAFGIWIRHASATSSQILFSTYLLGAIVAACLYGLGLRNALEGSVRPIRPSSWPSPDGALAARSGLVAMVIYVANQGDQFVVAILAGATGLAIYGVAVKFYLMAVTIPGIFITAYQSAFIQDMHAPNRQRSFESYLLWLTSLCAFLGGLTAAVGPWVLSVTFSQSYHRSGPIIVILATSVLAQAFHVLSVFMVRGVSGDDLSTTRTALSYGVRGAVVVGGCVAMYKLAGIQGLATGKSVADIIGFFTLVVMLSRRIGLRMSPLTAGLPILASSACLGAWLGMPQAVVALVLFLSSALALVGLVKLRRTTAEPISGDADGAGGVDGGYQVDGARVSAHSLTARSRCPDSRHRP